METPAVLKESFSIVKKACLVAGLSLSGPGTAFSAIDMQRKRADLLAQNSIEFRQQVAQNQNQAKLIKELIHQIRELWSFNITELADILGVSRPTVYNWIKEKTQVDSASYQHLQELKVAGEYWLSKGDAAQDYLLDYSGPNADLETLREALKKPNFSVVNIKSMINDRLKQYQTARSKFEAIIRDPLPLATKEMPEEARALTEAFAEMTHAHNYSSNA